MPTCNVLPYGGCGIGKYDSLFGPLNQYMILHWTFLVVIWVGPAGGFFPFCGLKLQGIIAIKSAFWLWQLYMADGSKKKVGPKALRLHHLHPDILQDILSRLEFKEAARMSILSSKWRRLWRCYQNLVFTRETMFSSGSNAIINRRRFIINVNSVLRQLSSTTVKKFMVRFKLRKPHSHHVDRWVRFAAGSKARYIIFDLSPGSWGDDHDSRYIFPLHHFSGSNGAPIRSLRLMFVCLKPRPDFCGFTNLKKLKLDAVSISGHLQCLLPDCAVLEWLSIVRCTLHGLQTSQPLHRLRYLHVKTCSGMQKIELQAPNLATFKFHDCPMPIRCQSYSMDAWI